ncbi:MAG: hypothetical protein C0514_02715 [Candidatus Puniceispirillum sp.]|nr:hypothetical protein [Candidatus Puniceispirillum sp.]
MIISCEGCSKRYLMDDGLMAGGSQMLRCAACGHVWTYTPAPAFEPLMASPDAQNTGDMTGVVRPARTATLSLITGTLFLVTLTCAFLARTSIVTTWPSVSPLFEFLGLTSQPLSHSLKISSVNTMEDAHGAVVLTGEIENTAPHAISLSALKIYALGPCADAPFLTRAKSWAAGVMTGKSSSCPLTTWSHTMTQTRLLPQEKLSFQTQPHEIPKQTQRLAIEF